MLTLGRWLDHERGGYVLLAVLAVLAIVVPICNLLVPEGSPLHLSTFMVHAARQVPLLRAARDLRSISSGATSAS